MSYRQTKNTFKVPRKTWESWSQRARYVYNRIMQESKGRFVSYNDEYLVKVTAILAIQADHEYECDNRRFP